MALPPEKHKMKPKLTIEQLLRWRLALAEAEAPPPPRATFLLELAQHRADTELSEELSRHWKQLKVTDRLPFRLILRSYNPSG